MEGLVYAQLYELGDEHWSRLSGAESQGFWQTGRGPGVDPRQDQVIGRPLCLIHYVLRPSAPPDRQPATLPKVFSAVGTPVQDRTSV